MDRVFVRAFVVMAIGMTAGQLATEFHDYAVAIILAGLLLSIGAETLYREEIHG